jgi:hypothetical protein
MKDNSHISMVILIAAPLQKIEEEERSLNINGNLVNRLYVNLKMIFLFVGKYDYR